MDNNAYSEAVTLEYQRYGRNKSTLINKTYIESGEYRRKFDLITTNANLARLLYNKAKEMLYHRFGTEYEDMYWIDAKDCRIIASVTDEKVIEQITYTPAILKKISESSNIVTMHTHPHSMPPSIEDINSCEQHKYSMSIVVCHNGRLFVYRASQKISEPLYDAYYSKHIRDGYDEFDAQFAAIMDLQRGYDISVKEVL